MKIERKSTESAVGGGGWGRGGVAEAFSGKEGLNRWWLLQLTVKILAILRLTVKILAILRLTVTIIPSLSPQIFFTVNIFYDY